MSAKDSILGAPSEIMVLHGRVVAVGVEYAPANAFVWNTRVAGEYLWNWQDGAWGYRVETAVGLRLDR